MAVKANQEFFVVLKVDDQTKKAYADAAQIAEGYAKSVVGSNLAAAKSLSSVALAVTGVNQALELVQKAYGATVGTVMSAVEAFAAQDKVENRLINTLKSLNQYNEATVKFFQDFANEVQRTTTVADELVYQLAAVAKNSGLTNAQTKELIKTSIGLAAVMDGDVNAAFRELIGQYQGVAGRSAKFIVGLKDLTEAQLRAGKGIELAAKQYGSFAESELQSLTGSLEGAKHGFGEIYEAVGGAIVRLTNLPKRVKEATDFFYRMAESIKEAEKSLSRVKEAFASVDWEKVGRGILLVAGSFAAFKLAAFTSELIGAIAAIGGLTRAIEAMGGVVGILTQISVALNASAILSTLKAITMLTIRFAALAIAIGAVAVAVDILIRNFDRLDKVGALIGNSFLLVFNGIARGIIFLDAKWQKFLFNVTASLNSLGLVGDKAVDAQSRRASAAIQTQIDLLKKQLEISNDIRENSSKIDFGMAGEAVKFLDKLLSDTKDTTKDIATENQNVLDSQKKQLELTKQQLDLLRQINQENTDLGFDLRMNAADAVEKEKIALEQIMQHIAARKEDLRIQGLLTDEIQRSLDAQGDLQEAISKEKIFKIQVETLSPFGQVFAQGAKKFFEVFDKGIDIFNDVFGTKFKLFGEDFAKNAGVVVGKVADFVGKAAGVVGGIIGYVIDIVQKIFDPDWINNLGKTLNEFIEHLPEKLMKAWDGLTKALDRFFEKLPEVIEKLLAVFISKLKETLPKMLKSIDVVFDVINMILDRLPEIFDILLDGFTKAMDKILGRLPETIEKLFSAIGGILASIIKRLPDMIVSLFDKIPDIVESIIVGIFDALGQAVGALMESMADGGAERIMDALVRVSWRLVVAIVRGIIRGLVKFFQNIWKGVSAPKWVTNLGDTISKGADKLGKKIGKETSQLFKVTDLADQFGVDPSKSFKKAVDKITEDLGTSIRGLWDNLKKIWDRIMENILKPFMSFMTKAWEWVKENIVTPLTTGVSKVWEWVKENVVTPLVSGLQQVWGWVYNTVLVGIRSAITSAWANVLNYFQNMFKGNVSNAFGPIMSFFQNLSFANALQPIKDYFDKFKIAVSGKTPDWIKTFQDKVEDLFKTPGWIKTLQDTVKKLSNINIGGSGGGGGGSSSGGVLNPQNWALGGTVKPIYAASGRLVDFSPRGNDTVPAMVEPGEFIVRRRSSNANRGLLSAINKANGRPVAAGITIGEVNINAKTDLSPDQIRREVVPALERELKRKSQDGRFVLATTGLRG